MSLGAITAVVAPLSPASRGIERHRNGRRHVWQSVMHFEWDRAKADANRRKHGVSFDEAVSIFYDPLSASFADPDASAAEVRLR